MLLRNWYNQQTTTKAQVQAQDVYLSVCVHRRISQTADPTWFSFTVKLFIGPGESNNNFFGEGTTTLPKKFKV